MKTLKSLIVVGLALATPLFGDVIVSVTGAAGGGYFLTNNVVSQGFLLPIGSTYTNVQIVADVLGSGTAYLTTTIGPGTTAGLREISRTTFNTATAANLTLFSGLTLGPSLPQGSNDVYYLTLVGQTSGAEWISAAQYSGVAFTITGATLATSFVNQFASIASYAPASDFKTTLSADLFFSVSGTPAAVPEPTTLAFVGLGFLSFLAVRINRHLKTT